MSQDPRTFNKEDKVTWDELADSLQKLITQIKTDLANEIIDRKAVCEKLQKEIDALFDKDGHLVFPNGNTIWIDANNGTLPSTGTGSGVTEVSDVTFDQLDSNMQDRLNDDKVGIAQALSEIEELKKSIQANADEITKLKAQLAASGAAAAAGGGGLFVDYPSGICVASGRDNCSYEFTAAEDCAISITYTNENNYNTTTYTGALRVNATATSVGPNTLADGFLFFKKGDTVLIALTASSPESMLSIIQYKLRSGNNGMKLDFTRATTPPYVRTSSTGIWSHNAGYYTIPENGYVLIKVMAYTVSSGNSETPGSTRSSSFSIGNLSVVTNTDYLDKNEHRCFPVSKDDVIHIDGSVDVVFIPLKK